MGFYTRTKQPVIGKIADALGFDEETNTFEVGTNLEVDGKLTCQGGQEVITSAQAVVDEGKGQLNLKQGETIVDVCDLTPVLASGDVDIIAKTITAEKVENPFEVLDFNVANIQGLTWESVYAKMVIKNGILWIVFTGKYSTDNTFVPEYNTSLLSSSGLRNKTDILSKIYTVDGTPMFPLVSNTRRILTMHSGVNTLISGINYFTPAFVRLECYSYEMFLRISKIGTDSDPYPIVANTDAGYVDIRIPLLLVG